MTTVLTTALAALRILTSSRGDEINFLHNIVFKWKHCPSFVHLHINSVDVMPVISILQRLKLFNSEMEARTFETTEQIQI